MFAGAHKTCTEPCKHLSRRWLVSWLPFTRYCLYFGRLCPCENALPMCVKTHLELKMPAKIMRPRSRPRSRPRFNSTRLGAGSQDADMIQIIEGTTAMPELVRRSPGVSATATRAIMHASPRAGIVVVPIGGTRMAMEPTPARRRARAADAPSARDGREKLMRLFGGALRLLESIERARARAKEKAKAKKGAKASPRRNPRAKSPSLRRR